MKEEYYLSPKEDIIKSPNKKPNKAPAWEKNFLPKGQPISPTKSFTVSENTELGYKRFVRIQNNEETGGEFVSDILISEEAGDALRNSPRGKVRTKEDIKKEIEGIMENPHGDSSIDLLHKNTKTVFARKVYENLRSVNKISSELERELGVPIAIKGSGALPWNDKGREDLVKQFIFMREKQKEWEKLPEYIKNIISIDDVYAVSRQEIPDEKKYEELLIMERVPDAKQVKDYALKPKLEEGNFIKKYISKIKNIFDNKKILGFRIDDHPLLAHIIETELEDHESFIRLSKKDSELCYEWSTLENVLKSKGLDLTDLAGRNLLYSEDDIKDRHYIAIDQRDRS